jgi:hypothetical protein
MFLTWLEVAYDFEKESFIRYYLAPKIGDE